MDYSNEKPERYWITNPVAHRGAIDTYQLSLCKGCGDSLDWNQSIPVRTDTGGLCQKCATKDIQDHPVTPTYLHWLETGDPRWWSAWCCNCEGCAPDETAVA